MPAKHSPGVLMLAVLASVLIGSVVVARYGTTHAPQGPTEESSLSALDPAMGLGEFARSSHAGHDHAVPSEGPPLRASIITVVHDQVKSYSGLRPRPSRSPDEARAIAARVAAEAKADPTRFSAIARETSEDSLSVDGGEVSNWLQGQAPSLDTVLTTLAVGAVSDPIETEYGFVVLRREAPFEKATISARRLVVAWKGASRAPAGVARTKTEALERATQLLERAKKDPASFTTLVSAESDGWDSKQGGAMGRWESGSGRHPLSIDKELLGLGVGEVGGPVESMFGYELLLRVDPGPVRTLFAGSHILISHRAAAKPVRGVTRSRAEALTLTQQILTELREKPERFSKLAIERSDDATAPTGGDLGSWMPGKMPVPIQSAFDRMRLGQVDGPVETEFGFHILLRRLAPTDQEFLKQ